MAANANERAMMPHTVDQDALLLTDLSVACGMPSRRGHCMYVNTYSNVKFPRGGPAELALAAALAGLTDWQVRSPRTSQTEPC